MHIDAPSSNFTTPCRQGSKDSKVQDRRPVPGSMEVLVSTRNMWWPPGLRIPRSSHGVDWRARGIRVSWWNVKRFPNWFCGSLIRYNRHGLLGQEFICSQDQYLWKHHILVGYSHPFYPSYDLGFTRGTRVQPIQCPTSGRCRCHRMQAPGASAGGCGRWWSPVEREACPERAGKSMSSIYITYN